MRLVRTRIAALAAAAALVAVPVAAAHGTSGAQSAVVPKPPQANPAHCPVGDSGITVNRAGDVAKFRRLTPMRGMNCASAQYVMNKWLRRAFRRSYSRRLPRKFWDGYVTWYCGKLTRLRWQCDEYDSDTRFRFTAYIIN